MSAVLLMAYGTPERLEDVEAYYTHIRRGSRPPPELLDELVERYRAVGGPTPLNRITRRQAEGLARELRRRGCGARVEVGFKHVAPFVGDAVRALGAAGESHIVGLVLAPHYSLRSVAEYRAAAVAVQPDGTTLEIIESWHDHPALIEAFAARLGRALEGLADPLVVFTAHSIPMSAVEAGDPYPDQLRETSRLVAQRAGVKRWTLAFQSAGRTAEPWLGPDIGDVIGRAAREGAHAVVVHPIGFVADHLEVLYDLDIEARSIARSHGLTFARVTMPNDDADFIAALADVLTPRLASAA